MKKKTKKIILLSLSPLLVFILIHIVVFTYAFITPKLEINKSQSFYLYDTKNELVFNDDKDWIPLKEISPYLVEATLSTEDKYFYKHIGFDYLRIGKAMITNIIKKDKSEGASTITQQYARNLFLNFEKTWKRKIDEALLATELEVHYSKNEILEGYLNTINYGGVYGIEAASKYYFNKSAKDLTLAEASLLAGIPKSPNNYSPVKNYTKSKERQKIVLKMMQKNKKITTEEYNNAINTNLTIIGKKEKSNITSINYFKDSVLEELKRLTNIPEEITKTGGLKIYTTLDIEAQEDLEKAVYSYINDETKVETAAIMMNPNTGGVIAMIGGNDYNKSEYNRATKAKRQVGSTFKPFVYATAIMNLGMTPCSTVSNATYTKGDWVVEGNGGNLTLRDALAHSKNPVAVRLIESVSPKKVIQLARDLGVTEEMPNEYAIALGSSDITIYEMLGAYSSFANFGNYIKPEMVWRIEDANGRVIKEVKNETKEVMNEMYAYTMIDLMKGVTRFGTASGELRRMGIPETVEIAGKTGTTQNNSDGWFMGITPNLATGVWVGWEDRATHFWSTGEGQGAKMALPIWGIFMKKVWADKELGITPDDKFAKPSNWTGDCADLQGLGGYGDDGGLQTIDQIKNPKPKDNQPKNNKPKEENLNENLNKDEVDFNQ